MRDELRATVRFAAPVVLTQIGAIAMGTVDTLMVGRLAATPLAAVALGNSVSFTALVVGMGVLLGLDPLVSQAFGAGRDALCGRVLRHGLLLAVALSVPIVVVLAPIRRLFALAGQPPELAAPGAAYVYAILPGILPFLLFTAMRQFLQGVHRVRPAMWIMLGANLMNVACNWVLIYGHWGAPAMGATGAAWATTLSRWAMAAAIAAYVFGKRDLARFGVAARAELDRALVQRIVRLGGPVGAQLGLELGVFTAAALLMGRIGTIAVAGHQIALNLCSITFMVPLGLSATAAARVGHALGRGDVQGARRAAWAAYTLGCGFMACSAIAFAVWRHELAGLYSRDPAVIAMGAALLAVGAAFQISDGCQTIGIGALRGAADTRVPMWVTAIGYGGLALPAAAALGFALGWGPRGVWWGLTLGLTFVAVALALRFHLRVRDEHRAALRAHVHPAEA